MTRRMLGRCRNHREDAGKMQELQGRCRDHGEDAGITGKMQGNKTVAAKREA